MTLPSLSSRVRYLSRSAVAYRLPSARESWLRTHESGTFGRRSAHSVSRMPVSGESMRSAKPDWLQKSRTTGQTFSGGWSTTSQRWLPWRSIRAMPDCGSTPCAVAPLGRGVAAPRAKSEYVVPADGRSGIA